MSDEEAIGAVGPDRRTFVRRLVIGSVFAAPIVASFTMSGVEASSTKTRGQGASPNTTTAEVPGSSQPPAPPGFPSNVVCFTVLAGGLDVTVPDGPVSLHLVVPPGALPLGTSLCIYRADLAELAPRLPAGHAPISGYAVVWTSPGGSQPDAIAPITLTVTDPAAAAGDQIFVFDKKTGTAAAMGAASGGVWVVTFVVDPGFVVTSGAATAVNAQPRATG